MAIDSVPERVAPTDVGFRRELGLIGATWASETSIIGSGWLFAPLTAALLIGGGAWLAWIIAAVVIIVLALAHAELGAMYPVSGGTARFPHFAFGSVAGIGFGFFVLAGGHRSHRSSATRSSPTPPTTGRASSTQTRTRSPKAGLVVTVC